MTRKSKPEHFEWWEQDQMFVEAMANAIALGFEHAPMGIDKRPCTINPRFVLKRNVDPTRTCSPLGDITTSGMP